MMWNNASYQYPLNDKSRKVLNIHSKVAVEDLDTKSLWCFIRWLTNRADSLQELNLLMKKKLMLL